MYYGADYQYSGTSQQRTGQQTAGSNLQQHAPSSENNSPSYMESTRDDPPEYTAQSQEYVQSWSSNTTTQQQQSYEPHYNQQQNHARNVSIYAENTARFGSPFAYNDLWSPTQEDYKLVQLPQIDFMLRVKARLARKAGNPFDPEPRSFLRKLPNSARQASPHGFSPIILRPDGKSGLIGGGFKPIYVGHLFTAHDVSAADFARFLEDIFTAGKVSGLGHIVAGVAPLSMHMGATGYFVTKAITKAIARRNEPLVTESIETWQERFFGPRGLDVFAVQEGERVTGSHVGIAPKPLSSELFRLVGGDGYSRGSSAKTGYESDGSIDSNASCDSQGRKLSKDEHKERKKRIKKQKKEREERRKKEKKERKEHEDKHKKRQKGPFLVIAPLNSGSATTYAPVYEAY